MGLDIRDNEFMFYHKVRESLSDANKLHHIIVRDGDPNLERRVKLEGIKFTFRNYFEMCFDPNLDLELPSSISLLVAQKAYKRSDFDWADRKFYEEFRSWIRKNLLVS